MLIDQCLVQSPSEKFTPAVQWGDLGCPHQILPSSGLREPCRGGGGNTVKAKGNGTKETRPSKHRKAGAHMNSQRLWHRAQGLYRFGPDGVLAPREMDTSPHP